jgi:hypothetical protein
MSPIITDEYPAEKKELISDFNEAKFQILRLHVLWQSCNTCSQNGNLEQWKWKLDAIWRELSPDAKERDKNQSDNENAYFSKIKTINDNISKARNNNEKYLALQEKEIFLRCLQDAVGKGSRKSSGDEDDFDA